MSAAARVRTARNVIVAAWECGRSALGDPATEAAQALEDRGLLQSPETAAELDAAPQDKEYVGRAAAHRVASLEAEAERLRTVASATEQRHEAIRALLSRVELGGDNDTETIGLALDVLAVLDGPVPPSRSKLVAPYACAWCDVEQRGHAQQWKQPVGWHTWQPPAVPLVLARMRARRLARVEAERDRLRARVAELEQQQAAALVGHVRYDDSPHCLSDGEPWPCPTVEALTSTPAEGRPPTVVGVYPPTFPWARWLDETDLPAFLDELAAAAIVHASSARALAEVEQTCAVWRPIADSWRAYLTAPGPNCTCPEPVLECTGEGCGCPVCHRAVVPAADVPVPYALAEPTAVVTSYAEQSAARLRGVLAPSDGGERP